MSPSIKNRTTLYILPFVTTVYHKSITAYLAIYELNDVEGIIYVTVDCDDTAKLITKQDNFKGKTYINDKLVLLLEIPKSHKTDYESIIIGNYTNISDKRKLLIYWKKNNNVYYNYLYNIFYNKDELRKTFTNILTLATNTFYAKSDDKEILDAVNSVNEIDDIFDLKDEIIQKQ